MFGRELPILWVGFLYILTSCSNSDSDDGSSDDPSKENGDSSVQSSDHGDVSIHTGSDDTGSGDTEEVDTAGCGNGVIELGESRDGGVDESAEVCDDGNSESGDGCAADCKTVEEDFACPMPGEPCVSTVVHGDGKISGEETCDDGNDIDGDGCSSEGRLEDGWECGTPGEECQAKACGDGFMTGRETCDDGNNEPGDGCSGTCLLEKGWACPSPNEPCHETVCNDGIREGKEPCDDGNDVIGDGCTPFCEIEPDCSNGACQSTCGDGIMLPGDNEECDDGNALNGDGCSDTCKQEPGFVCTKLNGKLPDVLEVPITFRDFIADAEDETFIHPDFNVYSGDSATVGLVDDVLGNDGKPVYTGICELDALTVNCPYDEQTTSEADFDTWYRDVSGINKTETSYLLMAVQPGGEYYFPEGEFFPWDNKGWVEEGSEIPTEGHNYGFTSEIRYWFEFKGGEYLKFSGDDDVWVFINEQLVVDLGGLHPRQEGDVTLDEATSAELGLEEGNVYEIVLFHAERHTYASNFNLTLSGFTHIKSTCESICGDGIVTEDEVCDDGEENNTGEYGGCSPDCTRGDYCGDGIVQEEHEECDDGINLTIHSQSSEPGCGPGCKLGSYCGDGKVDSLFGEQCDDGEDNTGEYGGCSPDCTLAIRCGDGILQEEHNESCDDGNTVSGDGCSAKCLLPEVV